MSEPIPTMAQIDAVRARVDLLVEVRRGTKSIADLKAAFPEVGDFPMVGVYEALQRDEVNRLISLRLAARERLGSVGGELLDVLRTIWGDQDARRLGGLLARVRVAIAAAEGREPQTFGKWVFSKDPESFSSLEYDTREAAVAEAQATYSPGEGFYVGQTKDPLELGDDADPEWRYWVDDAEQIVVPCSSCAHAMSSHGTEGCAEEGDPGCLCQCEVRP